VVVSCDAAPGRARPCGTAAPGEIAPTDDTRIALLDAGAVPALLLTGTCATGSVGVLGDLVGDGLGVSCTFPSARSTRLCTGCLGDVAVFADRGGGGASVTGLLGGLLALPLAGCVGDLEPCELVGITPNAATSFELHASPPGAADVLFESMTREPIGVSLAGNEGTGDACFDGHVLRLTPTGEVCNPRTGCTGVTNAEIVVEVDRRLVAGRPVDDMALACRPFEAR